MLSVDEALGRLLASAERPRLSETVPLAQAHGRRLAHPLAARRTQPPANLSAMDGYAVRAADIATIPSKLKLIGTSSAGHGFDGAIAPGETVRIFTGARVPEGADTILIQEDAEADGDTITAKFSEPLGRHVRGAGLDFKEGDVLLEAGRLMGPAELALAAAMNHATLDVVRKPLVAILATGDELLPPGSAPGPDQIIASNNFAVGAYLRQAGADVLDLGIAGDNFTALEAAIRRARDAKADVLVTLGGARSRSGAIGAETRRHGTRLLAYRHAPRQTLHAWPHRRDADRRPARQSRVSHRLLRALRAADDPRALR